MKKLDIYMRPLTLKDINSKYVSWFADSEVTEYLEAKNISISESKEYLINGIIQRSYYIYAIWDNTKNIHIGNIKVGPIRRSDGVSDLVTVIGDKKYWGKGIASKAIKNLKEKVFLDSGIRKFVASIDSFNLGSINAYMKAGFKKEANIKDFFVHKTKDEIFFSNKIYLAANNFKFDIKKFNKWEPISLEDIE
ncbi:MAG: hypothetical protein CFH33_01346 [Alphaproteobacteria bacterium MarineAlpha9_Bin3]|nr:MAG: hypothetical protein CFH33_01346 [Alphaproteobacteria bacterium MarineAlpha9_Bin3]|tara:strand:- start:9712 stop:10290 length:579 start_codon:yes stop_codon:yes gene_type:complete